MVYFINEGIVLEQVIAEKIEEFLSLIHSDNYYKNFHIKVTNNHPFAELFLHNNLRAADSFPCIVVSTINDSKTSDLIGLPAQTVGIGLDVNDLDRLSEKSKLSGVCSIVSDETINDLKQIALENNYVYGVQFTQRKTDSISIEIWADNVQLKNELYEQLRLFVGGYMQEQIKNLYSDYDISIFDSTIKGERSNNFNFDFGLILSGGNIRFDVNYAIKQTVIDTEIAELTNDILLEVINRGKEN